MGTIKKIGDIFYVEFEARGLKYQQIAGPDEKAAQALLETIESKLRGGELNTVVRDAPVPLFFQDFCEYIGKQYSIATVQRLDQAALHLADYLKMKNGGVQHMSQLTPKVLEDYKFFLLREKQVVAWQINFTLLLLREMFEYAIKMGYLNDNPTLHIRPVEDRRVYKRRDEQVEDFLRKGISIFRLQQAMNWGDVLRAMPYYPFLKNPLQL